MKDAHIKHKIITSFLLLLLIACSEKVDEKKYLESEILQTSIGINKSLKSVPIIISDKMNFFKEQGIKINITMEMSSSHLFQKLFSNELDFICIPEHLAAFEILNGNDFRILASMNRNQSHELIINKKSGIEDIKDLKGKKIGIKQLSGTKYSLYRLLLLNGLKISDVQLVETAPNNLEQVIINKSVDAIISWPPYTTQIKNNLKNDALVFNANFGRDLYWLLVTRTSISKKNSDKVLRVLKALNTGIKFANKFLEKAQNISADYFGFSNIRVQKEWEIYNFKLELPSSLLIAMEQEMVWKQQQLTQNKKFPNLNNIIAFSPLKKINPNLVTIIHERSLKR